MNLEDIYTILNQANLLKTAPKPVPDLEIGTISVDSRRVEPGAVFIAIPGTRHDGHAYVQEAIDKGAVAVISERPLEVSAPILRVVNSRKAAAILSAYYWGRPGKDLLCLGVTGTNGKTTTAFMIDAILEEVGYNTGLIGTVLTKIAGRIFESAMTTPDAPELHHLLHHMVEQEVEAVTMEVSSHGIMQDRCYGLELDVGILTNISTDHWDVHPTFEHYVETKLAFFDLVTEGGLKAANGDDPKIRQALASHPIEGLVTFGISPESQVKARGLKTHGHGTRFILAWNRLPSRGGAPVEAGEVPVDLSLPGKHNVYNSLAAATATLFLGIDPHIIPRALKSFSGVARRLQVIYDGDFTVIDDFAHNPASIKTALEAATGLTQGKLIIVNAIRGNRGLQINRENAETLADFIQESQRQTRLIVTASQEAVGEHDRVSSGEKEVFLQTLRKKEIPYSFFSTLKKAIKTALKQVAAGDLLLLLGAQGMDQGSRVFRELMAQTPEIAKADPFDELAKEPAIIGISEYLENRG
ncbi:MAG: UDP-N-acetylmuramoyl-L-alanyl-D-glutamate--2,6-diaminopimelate ligase [Firmicutes bacterium]|nr:UDP-N-acetylmuramoyl-L-alanyl-D-glutamate--2,6-diaminopimelate ligase [Bacillota bacterium]